MKYVLRILLIFFLLVGESCQKPPQASLSFKSISDTSLESILEQAKTTKKMIFVDCYAVWCGPCKYMDENIFVKPNIINTFSKNFINFKVDVENFDGVNISLAYKVSSFPTYLFLDEKGEVIHRLEGVFTEEGLLEEAAFAMNRYKQ